MASSLGARYAKSGTDLAYAAPRTASTASAALRACSTIHCRPGYSPTCDRTGTLYVVLPQHVVLPTA
eukprot:1776455-Rhodomonas_salina.3